MKQQINRKRRSHTSPKDFPHIATKRIVAFLIFLCVSSWLHSITWHIKQDGTGDFTTIQAGINAAANSDTVLVYPGTYYENLYIENKNITLASLELTTGNSQYINSTIIDGGGIESCIWVRSCNNPVIIRGFTIQNGSGSILSQSIKRGGGILSSYSVVNIINNRIVNNISLTGGGLSLCLSTCCYLSGNKIINNSANHGGGIHIGSDSNVTFDSTNKNSIYDNNAANGYDLYASDANHIHVIVDTFSIITPDCYFAKTYDHGPNYNTYFTFEIDFGLYELIPSDLYVAQEGEDSNSGISPQSPLRNISTAVRFIDISDGIPRTIHVAAGEYSHLSNQQIFPFGFKENLSIIGEDASNTIIVNDFSPNTFSGNNLDGNCIMANFSFDIEYEYPYGLGSFGYINNLEIKNCGISGISGISFMHIGEINNLSINNVYVHDTLTSIFASMMFFKVNGKMENVVMQNCNNYGDPEYLSASTLDILVDEEFTIQNCTFSDNTSNSNYCGNIIIRENPGSPANKYVTNCLFKSNESACDHNIMVFSQGTSFFTNCTFVDNNSLYSTIQLIGNLDLKNSIFSNPENAFEIFIPNAASGLYSVLDISYCDILGGESSVYNFNPALNTVNWLEGNIDADPLFLGTGDHPYQLSEFSPCIDAGTLDMPFGFSLPAYDPAGNPRVMGSNIDMGAYEFPDNPAPIYLQMDNETLFWQIPPGYSPTGYNVYLDGAFQAYVNVFNPQYSFSNLIFGESYTAGVSAVYDAEETAVIPLQFVYEPVGIEETTHLSLLTSHLSNYPNPFNPSTTIKLELAEAGKVELAIYNIKGQKVKTLIDAQLSSGEMTCTWNGRDEKGKRVASGEYIVKLQVNGEKKTVRKILLVK